MLQRLGGVNQALVARVPGSVPFLATSIVPGTETFNSNQFHQVFSGRPETSSDLQRQSGYGAELSYFNTFGRSATTSIGPDNPPNWLVMKAPGGFWQTQDFPYQAMAWSSSTKLYNAEINGRLNLSERVTVLAGFRWLRLNDDLTGTLPPPDRSAPTWKTTCPMCNLFQVTAGGSIGALPPFWNTGTVNNLYAVQIGIDGTLLAFGRFSLGGRMTVGLFDNNAEQSTGVSIAKVVYPTTASTNGLAVVSEAALQLKYRVATGLSLKAGYDVLWLVGVALAPGQIEPDLCGLVGCARARHRPLVECALPGCHVRVWNIRFRIRTGRGTGERRRLGMLAQTGRTVFLSDRYDADLVGREPRVGEASTPVGSRAR